MRNLFFLILLLASGSMEAVNDTSWVTIPAERGTTVKIIGIAHGDLWTWSYKDRNSRQYLNRFDTTDMKYISSVELDTGEVRLCDMFILADHIIALGSKGRWNSSGGMNVYSIDTLGKVNFTDTLVPRETNIAGFDVIVNRFTSCLNIVYHTGEIRGGKMQLVSIDANGKVRIRKSEEWPKTAGVLGTEDFFQLRQGNSGELAILTSQWPMIYGSLYYGTYVPAQHVLLYDVSLNRKFIYRVQIPGMSLLGFDIYFDVNKTLCLAGLGTVVEKGEKYIFVTALDSTGKAMHMRNAKVTTDCFYIGDVNLTSRLAGSTHTDNWNLTITDYATLPNGVTVMYLNCAAGNTGLVNAWGNGTCVMRTRAVYQIGPDHNVWSASFLSQHFDVIQGENEENEPYFTAGSFFHLSSRLPFGAGYNAVREMLINNSGVVLQNGNNLEVIYVSDHQEVNLGCIKLDTRMDKAVFNNYALTIPRSRIAEVKPFMKDGGTLLMLNENYILKLSSRKAIVIRQTGASQDIGIISI